MTKLSRRDVLAFAAAGVFPVASPALADAPAPFTVNEIVDDGNRFFGTLSRALADVVQEASSRWGLPNAYILGQEASGAFVAGLRYGEGKMYTRNAGNQPVFWQGPSLGFDAGADGDRTMMLVYNLPGTAAIFDRFGGLDGSAYFVGGLGFTALGAKGVVVVPIRTGLGWRLGVECELSEVYAAGDVESALKVILRAGRRVTRRCELSQRREGRANLGFSAFC